MIQSGRFPLGRGMIYRGLRKIERFDQICDVIFWTIGQFFTTLGTKTDATCNQPSTNP
jgi:hypothetical protein